MTTRISIRAGLCVLAIALARAITMADDDDGERGARLLPAGQVNVK